MPDAAKTLQIKIESQVELGAFERLQRTLAGQVAEAKLAGQAYDEYEQKLKTVSDVIERYRDASKPAAAPAPAAPPDLAIKSQEQLEQMVRLMDSLQNRAWSAEALGQAATEYTQHIGRIGKAIEEFRAKNPPEKPVEPPPIAPIKIENVEQLKQAEQLLKSLEGRAFNAAALGQSADEYSQHIERIGRAIADFKAANPPDAPLKLPHIAAINNQQELATAEAMIARLQGQATQAKLLGKDYDDLEEQIKRLTIAVEDYKRRAAAGDDLKPQSPSTPTAPESQDAPGGAGIADAVTAYAARLATLGTVYKAVSAGLKEFNDNQKASYSLDAALAAQGKLYDDYRQQLAGLAGAFEEATAVQASEWMGVFAQLTKFGADEGNIAQSVEAVKNLAGVLGGDLSTATTLISKAMQGSYEAFSRYGIKVKDTGTQSEKLAELFKMLEERGAGQLEARAKTLAGQWDNLKNKTNSFLGALVKGVADTGVFQGGMEMLAQSLDAVTKAMDTTQDAAPGVKNAVSGVSLAFKEGAPKASDFADEVERIRDAANEAAKELQRVQEMEDARKDHQQQLADIQHKFNLDRIKEAEKRGLPKEMVGILELREQMRYMKQIQDMEEAAKQRRIQQNEARKQDVQEQVKQQEIAIQRQGEDLKVLERVEEARRRVASAQNEIARAEAAIKARESDPKSFVYTPQGEKVPQVEAQREIEREQAALAAAKRTLEIEEQAIRDLSPYAPKGATSDEVKASVAKGKAELPAQREAAKDQVSDLDHENQRLREQIAGDREKYQLTRTAEIWKFATDNNQAMERYHGAWMGAFRGLNGKVDDLTRQIAQAATASRVGRMGQ